MSDYAKFIQHVIDIKDSLTKLTDRISTLEGKLSNGINSDIKELKDFRIEDKKEAIASRKKLEDSIVKAIKTNWQTCPTTQKINKFLISKGAVDAIKKNSQKLFMWVFGIGMGLFYFVVNIILKATGVL